ncbi:DUF6415 family natural product biosynthesis protein [Streptomyces sp. NPDC005407]|uniref:DUF6415 family natural product biosynthesis protein n=1 Tax=Streptomyces sp. NPDC005407 TaxID=3155340 RepID=UPI0033A89046
MRPAGSPGSGSTKHGGALHTTPGFGPDAAYRQAQRLARSVNALCDHYENLRCAYH